MLSVINNFPTSKAEVVIQFLKDKIGDTGYHFEFRIDGGLCTVEVEHSQGYMFEDALFDFADSVVNTLSPLEIKELES